MPITELSVLPGEMEEWKEILERSDRPDLLRALVECSVKHFGYFDTYFPYTILYPWLVSVAELFPVGAVVADLGAGISVLPAYLASRGFEVETVDNHPTVRTLPVTEEWNGWGFFDYSVLSNNLRSHHCSAEQFLPSRKFDAIYSIGSMAHMPAQARNEVLRRSFDWLRPSGHLVLGLDLIPSSDFLWNRREGQEVEPPVRHGSIGDLVNWLRQVGFDLETVRTVRSLMHARTDLLLLHCRRPRNSKQ